MPGKGIFHLKNEMLFANFIANFIGVFLVDSILVLVEFESLPELHPFMVGFDLIYGPVAFISIWILTLRYERPIRRCIPALLDNTTVDPKLRKIAERRVLNEPFVLMFMDICVWAIAAIAYPTLFWFLGSGTEFVHRSLYMAITTGCITITLAFFFFEHLLQKRLSPVFFPDGGIDQVPGTLRIKIRTRLAALLFACNLIPLLSILDLVYRLSRKGGAVEDTLTLLQRAVTVNTIIFLLVGIVLTLMVSRNLTVPFTEIIRVLNEIKRGRFNNRVRVVSNDEIGYTGEVINEMTEGLQERDQLRESLRLAREVQQNLMPKSDPLIEGIEIAGTSIYCDQTGGDYYDYLIKGAYGKRKIGVVVGDVSGHGIPSALLMISGRAFLRQRATMAGGISQIVSDVNREICLDVEESGRFMTLFFSEIDRKKRRIRWVNAGHEPAFIYDPEEDRFEELKGGGLPLGVFEDSVYEEKVTVLEKGQMVIIGTDGIWECRNPAGDMFGKGRFKQIIRNYYRAPAREIVSRVIQAVDAFRDTARKEDDITLVIAKIMV